MLLQASKLYTPIIFEAFQSQYERSITACTSDSLDQTCICSCNLFNRIGILCLNALKVLDLNIKSLPPEYVLK
jgi:hypothetical protein